MKAISIILISITLSLGASAQRKGYYQPYASRVYITPFGYGYRNFGYPYFGSPYFGNPYRTPYYQSRRMPYELSLQIESIKIDYKNRIREARKDKSSGRSERRKEVRSLKAERDREIINAQIDFSRSRRMNHQNRGNQNSSPADNS